ncbi:MAG: DinB family protein [Planctomycetota bacterium]|nr:DinB family protein [Planctomycetota bacterium]
MRAQDAIAEAILSTKPNLSRYLAGFDDSTRAAQAPNLPNHAAWNLGHLSLTMHRAAQKLNDSHALPPGDFVEGAGAAGDSRRFAAEAVAFGSTPSGSGEKYPPLARCVEIYGGACDALAHVVRGLTDADLHTEVAWGSASLPKHLLAMRMVFHNGMHTGQIADLRRAFKFRSVFS